MLPEEHFKVELPRREATVGVGSDGKTVTLTLFEGSNWVKKTMQPKAAIHLAYHILREAVALDRL